MEKDESSIQKKYGVVIILDALGTKGIWRDNNPEIVIKNWEEFIDSGMSFLKNESEYEKFNVSIHAFSDTIIITISGDKIESLVLDVFMTQILHMP